MTFSLRALSFSIIVLAMAMSTAKAGTAVAVSPTTGAYGVGVNISDLKMASRLALNNCRKKLAATDCQIVHTSANPGFGALAMSENGNTFVARIASNPEEAVRKSSEGCEKEARARCHLITRWQENEAPLKAKSFLSEAQRLFQKVRELQKTGEYDEAFQKILALAKQGIPQAQFEAGVAYEQGQGTGRDPVLAEEWLQQAAAQMEEGADVALSSLRQDQSLAASSAGVTAFRSKSISRLQQLSDAKVDALVRSMPAMASHQEVGAWIAAQGLSERQTARAVFVWIADNIAYDVDAYFNNARTFYDPPNVFRTRKTVCDGYANLFNGIAKAAGLKSAKVVGYSKSYGYTPGKPLGSDDMHAWNTVWFDNAWHLLDVTWGAGGVDSEGQFVRGFSPYWFNTDPRLFIYSHLGPKPELQLLTVPVSKQEFQSMPLFSDYFIASALQLGESADAVLAALRSGSIFSAWEVKGLDARIEEAPVQGNLSVGESYRIKLTTESEQKGALIIDNDFVLKSNGTTHEFNIQPQRGKEMHIAFEGKNGSYSTLLMYQLRGSGE